MAATVAVLGTSVLNTTAGNKTITATPTVGDLIVVITVATGVTTSLADNGTGGTYTQVDSTRTGFSTSGNLQVWVRNALVSSATSTTYTATQTSSTGGGLVILRVTGMSLTGASAVRSSGGQSTGTAATTPAPVLSLTPLSGNPIITAVANASNSTTTLVPRTGYTEDFDNGYNTPATGLEVNHRISGETSATLTQGGTSGTAFASIAIELAFDTAPTVTLDTPVDIGTVSTTTPQVAFTGTDADSDTITYEVQVDTTNTFNTTAANPSVINSFLPAGTDTTNIGASGGNLATGQTFQASQSGTLASLSFKLKTAASPTGNITAALYAHTGTFGTTGVPTGAALSTSTTSVSAATLTSTLTWIAFAMPATSLVSGTSYVATVLFTDIAGGNSVGVQDDNVSSSPDTSDPGNRVLQNSGGTWSAVSNFDLAYQVGVTGALIDKLSNTDTGFVDITNGADTDPFASGDQIGYTVQAGDALTNGVTYYWRARGKDPSGTNTYGAWATTRSFSVSSGTSVTVTQVAATVTATGGTQVVATARNVAITQVAATVTATGGTQSITAIVIASASITQVAGSVTASGGMQVVATIQKVAIAQVAGAVTASGGTQIAAAVVIASASIAQVAATVTATGGTQTVAAVNIVSITQTAASVTASGGTQSISTINNVALSQLAGAVAATGGTQAIATVNNSAITQVPATVTAAGGTQVITTGSIVSVSVTQVAASVTATGGTQVMLAAQVAAVAQSAATVTASGGTQVVATVQNVSLVQPRATVTATGGTQTIATSNIVSISQTAASVTASGGTQTVDTVNNSSITQIAGSVTATGGTQSLTAQIAIAIAQQAAQVTATGGLQDIFASSGATSIDITQVAGSVTASGGVPVITTSTGPLPPTRGASLIFLTNGQSAVRLSNSVYLPL